MEEQNTPTPRTETLVTEQPPVEPAQPQKPEGGSSKRPLIIGIIILLLIAGGVAAYFLFGKKDSGSTADSNQLQQAENEQNNQGEQKGAAGIDCGDSYTAFADREFGAVFCYPSEWGTAAAEDARIGADDTGHRQTIAFSRNPQFVVGGVSDDWATNVGRGGGCLEPSNMPAELSSYNVEWHDISEDFAQRSLESSAGGYDMVETVGNFLSGVCATGHKVIDGSRYRVISASYFSGFTAGVASVADHMADPYVLFRETERDQLDKLLASIRAY